MKCLTAVLALLACANAFADPPRRVFAMRFAGNGVSDEKVQVVQGMVVVEAGKLPGLQVTNYLDVVNVVTQEQARQLADCTDSSCGLDVAGTLAADELLTGTLGMLGSKYVLSLTRQDARSGAVLHRASDEFEQLETVGKQLTPLVYQLYGVPWTGTVADLDEELEEAEEPPAPRTAAKARRRTREDGEAPSPWRALMSPAAAVLPCLLVGPALLTGCGGVCYGGYVAGQDERFRDQVFPACSLGCTCCTLGCGSMAATVGLVAAGTAALYQDVARRFALAIMLGVLATWTVGVALLVALAGVIVGGFLAAGQASVGTGVLAVVLFGGPLLVLGAAVASGGLALGVAGGVAAVFSRKAAPAKEE